VIVYLRKGPAPAELACGMKALLTCVMTRNIQYIHQHSPLASRRKALAKQAIGIIAHVTMYCTFPNRGLWLHVHRGAYPYPARTKSTPSSLSTRMTSPMITSGGLVLVVDDVNQPRSVRMPSLALGSILALRSGWAT
jgi:hypothetical protein